MNSSLDVRGWLLSLLWVVACSPVSITPQQTATTPSALPLAPREVSSVTESSGIRPTSKGQRLEFGEITGDLIVPAESATLLVWHQPSRFEWLTGAAAFAAELSEQNIRQLQARVENTRVTLTLENTQIEANGDIRARYHLSQVPVQNYTQLLEFYSPSESISLKGILPEVQANQLSHMSDPIDLDTTAALEVIAQDDTVPLEQITPEELRRFSKKPELQEYLKFLRQEFKRADNKQRKFSEIANQFNLKEKALPGLQSGLKELKEAGRQRCQKDPERCQQRLRACVPNLFRRCKPLDSLLRTHTLRP